GGQIRSTLTQPFQNFLRRNVSYQCVLRERAASQAAEGRIETTETGLVWGRNVLYCWIRPAVQVHADFQVVVLCDHRGNQVTNLMRSSQTDRIRERNRLDSIRFQQMHRSD